MGKRDVTADERLASGKADGCKRGAHFESDEVCRRENHDKKVRKDQD
jgi:hypothetical protein